MKQFKFIVRIMRTINYEFCALFGICSFIVRQKNSHSDWEWISLKQTAGRSDFSLKPDGYFFFPGNFAKFSWKAKSPPCRIALRRRKMMSLKRPAAGGESCRSRILFVKTYTLLFANLLKYNRITSVFENCRSVKYVAIWHQRNQI